MRLSTCIVAVAAIHCAAALSCNNDDNNAVDIFLALKGPQGSDYAIWDSSSSSLSASTHSMNSTTTGAIAHTLTQLWADTSISYLIWNDEIQGGGSYNYTTGHSKGIWAWDSSTGDAIIFQHSVPGYPDGPNLVSRYSGLPSSAKEYGQHVACFHTTIDALARLASLATLIIPSITDQRINAGTPASIASLAAGAFSTKAACLSTNFTTQGGVGISYFAKSTQWDQELYSDCVAPALGADLSTDTWQHGDEIGATCNTYQVVDVKGVSYPGGLSFDNYDDHSKWAVGTDSGSTWFCPADINRQTSQEVRGGSAYCFRNAALASTMQGAITSTDSC